MHQPTRLVRFIILTAILALASGCTAKMKRARHLDRGDRYFTSQNYDAAEIEYLNVLQLEAENPHAIVKLGLIYAEQGRVGRMFPFLVRAKQLSPNNLEVRVKLGMMLASVGNRKEAHAEALFVLEHRPTDADAPLLLAETASDLTELEETKSKLTALNGSTPGAPLLTALGIVEALKRNNTEALELFKKAVALDPKFAGAYGGMGATYLARNDTAQAETAFTTAASLSPVRSLRRIQLARFHFQVKKAELAQSELQDVLRQAPDFLPAWLLSAEILATDQKYDESIAAIGKVLARDDSHPEALVLLGRVRLAKGEIDKAIADLERGAGLHPQSAMFHHQLGLTYMAKGELGKASASLAQAVNLAPTFVPANLALAELSMRQNNPAAAATSLRQFLQKQPGVLPAQLLLALALRAQGKLDEAMAIYRGFANAAPRNPQPLLLMGGLFLEQKKRNEARAMFERALELEPTYFAALELLINLDLTAKDYASARKRIEAYLQRQPEDAMGYLLLAKTFLAQSDNKQAEATLLKSIKLNPNLPLPYFLLARLYLSSNEFEKAIANLQQAATANPKNTEALMLLGTIQEQQKNFTAARDSYEKLLKANPRAGAALNNLACLYSDEFNEQDKAFEAAQRARELLPNQPHAADTLGWIIYKRGQYPWALSLLAESAEKLPTSAEVQFHLGMTQYMLGDEQSAKATLEKALQLSSEFVGAATARDALAMLNINPKDATNETLAALEKKSANQSDPVAAVRLGAVYERNGALDKALAAYTTALKLSPNNVRAAVGTIRIYRRQNQTAKALELARNTRKIAPDDPELTQVLGELAFDSGDYRWSAGLLQEMTRGNSANPAAYYTLARATYAVGQVSDAEANLRRALDGGLGLPNATDAKNFLAMINVAAKPTPAEKGAVDKLLQTDPDYLPALVARAALQESSREAKQAETTYEQLLAKYPDFSPAKKRLVQLYAENPPAKPETASALAVKARSSFPSDAEVAKACGIIAYRKGDYTQSLTLLTESSRQRADDSDLLYYMGMTQYQLKQKAECKRLLQKFLSSNPRPDLAAEAQKVLNELT